MRSYRCFLTCTVLFLGLAVGRPGAAGQQQEPDTQAPSSPQLQVYKGRYYKLHTNLDRRVAEPLLRHMDAMFRVYRHRFRRFRRRREVERGKAPLYIFRKKSQYQQMLRQVGVDPKNTGGMFLANKKGHALLTWAQGRPRSQTFRVLQHEAFHQFAWFYIGEELPIWVNEGLAQYYEDGIPVDGDIELGLANGRRIMLLREALKMKRTIPVEELLTLSQERWRKQTAESRRLAQIMYAQAWSTVYFFIHAKDGRYRDRFRDYLHALAEGSSNEQALEEAFETQNLNVIEPHWKRFARRQKPDPLLYAVIRMRFLGEGLRYLYNKHNEIPASLKELRRRLVDNDYRVRFNTGERSTIVMAEQPGLYAYPTDDGKLRKFRLKNPRRHYLPGRIVAEELDPTPILDWGLNDKDKLIQRIEFRD